MKKQLIALTMVFSAFFAKAQESSIIYYEFIPDSCHNVHTSNTILKFDLDQDGAEDVWFYGYYQSGVGSIAMINTPSPSWQWSHSYASVFEPLTDTTMIAGNLRWQYTDGALAMYPDFTHYAFRQVKEDGYHYGWAEIHVESVSRFCISRMAYCTIPNYPLRWGETSLTGIEEEDIGTQAFATVHPNPTTGLVTVAGENLKQAEILNTLGQVVATAQGNGHSLTMDIGHLPAGIYFVSITNETGRKCVRKVVKE